MSKRIVRCPKCGEKTEISAFSNNPDILMCCVCKFKGKRGAFEAFIPTIFDRITASPKVLAEKLVYCNVTVKTIPSTSREQPGGVELTKGWYSTIIPKKVWSNEEEAIAATVARLKEVEK